MARPVNKTVNPEVNVTDADTPGLPAVAAASNERAQQLVELDSKYGNGMLYDRERVISEFNIHVGNASKSLIEAGKCVLLIHEHEPRGDFDRLVEERLGIGRRSAYKFMSATRRLLEMNPETVQPVAQIGQTKLLDLMVEADNDDLEELAKGGTFAGMTLDEIECMTKRELQAALREARENEQAVGRILREKNEKLDKLAAENSKKPPVTEMWDVTLLGVSDEIDKIGRIADELFGKHIQFLDVCEVVADKLDPEQPDYRGKLEQVRVPIGRLGDQIERFAHIVARLRFDFDTRVGGYLDKTHILSTKDAE